MSMIDTLFDRMDAWRHLPNYQLERRADLFFSLYLQEVLAAKLGLAIADTCVPEFPVRIGTIYPAIPIDKSYKIDYVTTTSDAKTAIFIELKTEGRSRRENQDKYLLASQKAGFPALLAGVLNIFRATQYKRKYYALLSCLEAMRQLRIPSEVKQVMSRPNMRGLTEASNAIEITSKVDNSIIVYIQPNGEGNDIVSFEDFSRVVQTHNDPISNRFAKSLKVWAEMAAGDVTSGFNNLK